MRHKSIDPRCARCGLKVPLCMCASLPSLATRTHVAFVTPSVEHEKSTNTGRLARACLPNSSVHFYGADLPELPEQVWPDGHTPLLLFPVRGATPVSPALLERAPLALVVLDANWRQAARMRKRFLLRGVVPVAIPLGDSIYKLRHEPHAGGVSSLEAVARALSILEGEHVGRALVDALRIFQDRTLWTRGAIDAADVTGGVPPGVLRQM